jgi:hypothetical protein
MNLFSFGGAGRFVKGDLAGNVTGFGKEKK